MSNLWDYNQEAPIHYLIARHWDALKIEAVCRSLLAAVPKQQLENFLVADSLQREKVQAYFAAFKDQPLEYLHAQFHLFYQVAAPDDYNDLRGQLQLTFQADETAYTVLLGMARLVIRRRSSGGFSIFDGRIKAFQLQTFLSFN